ncbi:MAG: ABC transporter ATP-binding protein [Deltaproteobacteria bacterium]|jgi:putative ABC transport system ATP-binding protein|nr:ABC transporter ATP-binding protein [Deltaproteobacteria bacterium]
MPLQDNTPRLSEGPQGDALLFSLRRVVKTRPGKMPYFLKVAKLKVSMRDRIALVGQSGSGKSTLLDMLALVLAPDRVDKGGEFLWLPESSPSSVDVWKDWQGSGTKSRERVRREDLGYVLQSGGLLPFLSVSDNITLPALLKGKPKGAKLQERLQYLAGHLGIGHLLKKFPGSVSVGERQRVAVARALIHSPSLLLADEPTASLDPPTADRVFELFLELAERTDAAIVLATHNRAQAEKFGFQAYTIECEAKKDRILSYLVPPKAPPPPSEQGRLIVVRTSDPS